jgi:hypothetical protein
MRNIYKILVGKPAWRDQLKDLNEERILKWMLNRDVRLWTELDWLSIESNRALVNTVMSLRVP